MKKRFLSLLLCCVMLLGLMPTAAFAEGSTVTADITGEGTAENPYLIYTAAGLKAFRDKVNGQNWLTKQPGAHAKLMNDIVLNDGTFDKDGNYTPGASVKDVEAWTPIGYYKNDSDRSRYAGTFDGNGHTVKGLYVYAKDEYGGLFGSTKNATIKNVTVDGYVEGTSTVGGIVGWSNGSCIESCVNLCSVVIDGDGRLGGIAGIDWDGKILNCANLGTVSASPGEQECAQIGGIVGDTSSTTVTDSYNAGKVMSLGKESADDIGGIAGTVSGDSTTITNCYNAGKMSKESTRLDCYVGGVAGYQAHNGTISNCYWLSGTANSAVGNNNDGTQTDVGAKSNKEFEGGTVLNLLKNDRTDSPWEKCGYLDAAGMIVPLLKGQTSDTFPIYTAQDLKTFRDMVNGGESGANAKLMNDIDLGEEEWLPIGSESHPYAGSFDGQGYTVKALKIERADCAGLFGCTNGATIKNVTVIGKIEVGVSAYEADEEYVVYAGGVVGRAANTRIENCTNKVNLYASLSNDYFNIDKNYTAYAGGIAGYTGGSTVIVGCTNSGRVLSASWMANAYAGGMTGYAQNGVTIENCLNNAYVSATTTRNNTLPDGSEYDNIMAFARAGGMVGVAADGVSVTGCYNIGEVSTLARGDKSGQSAVGGIIGVAFAQLGDITVANCGNVAKLYVWGKSGAVRAGGIVCEASATNGCVLTISNCYSTGSISVPDDRGPAYAYAGGAAGLAMAMSGNLTISNCYWLTDSCDKAVGNIQGTPTVTNVAAHSKSDFADGTVLGLLKQNDTTNAWDVCGYVAAADMTLPLLHWQTLNARKYDIYITGVQITSLNRNDVLGDGKVSFVYDETNKKGILTLDGVNIVCNDLSDDYPINAPDMENLEIVLKGENKIEAEWLAGITADNLTFSGEGSIEISTDCIWPVDCTGAFTVNGGNVKISGIDRALVLDGALTVNGGTLELIASGEYGHAIDFGWSDVSVIIDESRIMITGNEPDGSDAGITAASEVDTVKAARYVKILSKYIPIVYAPGQYGEGSAVTQNKTYGEDFNLAGALFTRTGYQQIGWALSDGGDKTYELGSAYTGNEPLTLYPVWEAEQYSITYDPNGGTIGSGNVTGYTYGVGATLPTDVTRTGYTFDGWYDNAELEGTAVTSISDTDSGNKTYYAKWTENSNYIVIFISNGGTPANDKKTVRWTDKVLDGVAAPTRNGYDFAGWKYVDTDVTSDTTYADLAANDTVVSVTLAAQWRDIAVPTGEIKVAENGWKSFLNTVTFGLFFKDTQTVTVTAADNSGETVTIEYLLSDKALTKSEFANMTFTAYSAPFSINPDNEYVIYVKLTDTSRNVAYINTNGIVLDATVPVISGIENGKTYCAAQTVTVTEKYIDTVKVNGTKITLDENNQFTLSPAVGTQTVVVTDKAGNETRVTVTVNDGHTGGEATCTDKAICEICGESYGELNANNHADMKHTDAKAATKTDEGNIEYWYCADCSKYFADKDGAKEITKADTVTAKLPEEKPTSPKTGDTSNLALWIALLFISGGAVTATTVISKKKKHSKE